MHLLPLFHRISTMTVFVPLNVSPPLDEPDEEPELEEPELEELDEPHFSQSSGGEVGFGGAMHSPFTDDVSIL